MTAHETMIAQLSALAQRLSKEDDARLAHAGDSLALALGLLEHAEARATRAESAEAHYRAELEGLTADVPRIVSDAIMALRRA